MKKENAKVSFGILSVLSPESFAIDIACILGGSQFCELSPEVRPTRVFLPERFIHSYLLRRRCNHTVSPLVIIRMILFNFSVHNIVTFKSHYNICVKNM